MNAYDLINSGLRVIAVLSGEESASVSDANQSLDVLNGMIDAWNAERNAIYTTRIDDFPYVPTKQTYTLGTGGDFNIPRPARIDAMSSILLYNPDNPVEVPIAMYTVDEWQTQVPVKSVKGTFPLICYDDGGYPLRSLSFWPIPQDEPNSVRIYSWQALPAQTLTSQISFPPGYGEALKYNLAVRLAAEFGVEPIKYAAAIVNDLAVKGLARIKSMNAPELGLRSDLVPDPSGWDYKADLFGIGL
jgi:hypothetical protein